MSLGDAMVEYVVTLQFERTDSVGGLTEPIKTTFKNCDEAVEHMKKNRTAKVNKIVEITTRELELLSWGKEENDLVEH